VGVPVWEASVALQGRGRWADGGCLCGGGLSGVSGAAGDDLTRGHPGDPLRRMWAGIFPPGARREGVRGAAVSEGWSRWCGEPKR
jgi:hypothetical protein